MKILTPTEALARWQERDLHPWEENYLAFYSSYWNAILTDPRWLLIPVDDHGVHRGDGVFEAFRLIENNFYLLPQHLKRLRASAKAIAMTIPWSDEELTRLIQSLAQVAQEPQLIFRLFITRGTGSFSANPYDCPHPQLTLVACRFKPYPQEKYETGVRIGRATIPQKTEPFCQIKSFNYLPNVLMKKEAVDRSLDFVVGFSPEGYLTESSTENIFLLSPKNELLYPRLNTILRGTTLERCLTLAKEKLNLSSREEDLTVESLKAAKEVFIIGTTLDLLPVLSFEDHQYMSDGKSPRVSQQLLKLLREDQKSQTHL